MHWYTQRGTFIRSCIREIIQRPKSPRVPFDLQMVLANCPRRLLLRGFPNVQFTQTADCTPLTINAPRTCNSICISNSFFVFCLTSESCNFGLYLLFGKITKEKKIDETICFISPCFLGGRKMLLQSSFGRSACRVLYFFFLFNSSCSCRNSSLGFIKRVISRCLVIVLYL